MLKKRKNNNEIVLYLFLLILIIAFPVIATFTTNNQSTFDQGVYDYTFYNISSGFVQLNATNITGDYTSKIFNAESTSSWTSISWVTQRPIQKELPNNGAKETDYTDGNVNMIGNIILMHMNEISGILFDNSSNGNNGTSYGTTYGVTGKFNSSQSFDGDDYIRIVDSLSLNVINITVEAWINTQNYSGSNIRGTDNYPIVSKQQGGMSKSGDEEGYELGINSEEKPYFIFENTTTNSGNFTKYNNTIPLNSDTVSYYGQIPLGSSGKGDDARVYTPTVIKEENIYHMWYTGRDGSGKDRIYYANSSDGLTWYKYNNTIPLNSNTVSYYGQIPLGSSGKGDDAHVNFKSVIKYDNVYHMYYSASDGSTTRIYYANSSDGLTWYKVSNIAPPDSDTSSTNGRVPLSATAGKADDTNAGASSVIKDGSAYKMWYSGMRSTGSYYAVTYASSEDGLIWEKFHNTAPPGSDTSSTNGRVPPGTNLKGDDSFVYAPSVIKDGPTYKMWYSGWDGSNYRIYYATANVGVIGNNLSNGWHHVTGVKDELGIRIYVDGIQISSNSQTPADSTFISDVTNNADITIGDLFNGTIDELAIYNRSLSNTEILDHYKRGILRLKFQIRSCDDELCSGEEFSGPNNNSLDYYSEVSNSLTTTPSFSITEIQNNQYFQYIAIFETDNVSYTPELTNVLIENSQVNQPMVTFNFPSNGSYITIDYTLLNITIYNHNLTNMSVWFYGNDNIIETYYDQTNGTNLAYNWTELSQGLHNWTVIAGNGTLNSTTVYKYFTIDTIYPSIDYVSPTEINGSTLNRTNILVNVTSSDANLANITIYLYNSDLSVINSTTSATSPYFVNFTDLSNGIYYINSTSFDLAGNSNITNTTTINISATVSGTIGITYPGRYVVFQRHNQTTGEIIIHGNYTGTPSSIQAQFNNQGFNTIVLNPSNNLFTGRLNATVGNGTLTIRFSDNASISYNQVDIGVGDIFVISGQSNAEGRANNAQSLSSSNQYLATVYREDDVWKLANDPIDTNTDIGSPFPFVANYIVQNQSTPVAFITTASGATSLLVWRKGANDRYENMISQVREATNGTMRVKSMLFHQGESDALPNSPTVNGSYDYYKENLTKFASDFLSDTEVATTIIVAQIGELTTSTRDSLDNIRRAQRDLWYENENISAGPTTYDLGPLFDGVHFKTANEIRNLANRWWASIGVVVYNLTDGRGPMFNNITMTSGNNQTIILSFNETSLPIFIGNYNGALGTNAEGWRILDGDAILTDADISTARIINNWQIQINLTASISTSANVSLGSFNDASGDDIARDSSPYNLTAETIFQAPIILLTYSDAVYPRVSVVYPQNTMYNTNVTELNYTVSDETSLSSCWYTLNNGLTNTTIDSCGSNITGITSNEGSNTWIIYANDTSNNLNSSSVTFNKDTINPILNITYPINNTNYTTNSIEINYTFFDVNIQSCSWTSNDGITNHSITCGNNITEQTWNQGYNTIIIYVNDTVNNVNSTSVNLFVDSIFPEIFMNHPENRSYNANITELNYTITDENILSCWYSLNNGSTNTSITCGSNITGITSNEGSNTWIIYANDTSNNLNSSSKTFLIDSIIPSVTINSPTATTYTSNTVNVEIVLNEEGYCEFSTNLGTQNLTTSSADSLTFTAQLASLSNTNYILNAYCNDTAGNMNYTNNVSFTVNVQSGGGNPGGGGGSSGGGGGSSKPVILPEKEEEIQIDTGEISIMNLPNKIEVSLNQESRIVIKIKNNCNEDLHNVKLMITGLPLNSYSISPDNYNIVNREEEKEFMIIINPDSGIKEQDVKLTIISDEESKDVVSTLVIKEETKVKKSLIKQIIEVVSKNKVFITITSKPIILIILNLLSGLFF